MAEVEDESWRGFSIPDLWAPSHYWLEDEEDAKLLFPPLKFEGRELDPEAEEEVLIMGRF